jgi:hypothetical protein
LGVLFADYLENACCLCGSKEALTGEHKIKASALRSEFGREKMVIGITEDPSTFRNAQGIKSKVLHFSSRVCANCNNVLTQAPDREFDFFMSEARTLLQDRNDPKLVFENPRYRVGSDSYLNIFRYFAKLLCCHLGEIRAPRPMHLSRFARGLANQNCVWLDVVKDVTYRQISAKLGEHQYAAHGGLIVYGDKHSRLPNAFHSTLTIGPICFVFFSRLNWFEKMEIKLAHTEFRTWCSERVSESIAQPLSQSQMLRLGLAKDENDNQ